MFYAGNDKAQDVWNKIMTRTNEDLQLGDLREVILQYFKDIDLDAEIEVL